MNKKIVVFHLTLILALGICLQATPALAQRDDARSGAFIRKAVWAQIQSAKLLPGFPPVIRVEGILPSSCSTLSVSKPVVGMAAAEGRDPSITVFVRGLLPDGVVCSPGRQPFVTTVTIDPFQLDLAPGRYLVRFNPGRERIPFRVRITIPPRLD